MRGGGGIEQYKCQPCIVRWSRVFGLFLVCHLIIGGCNLLPYPYPWVHPEIHTTHTV